MGRDEKAVDVLMNYAPDVVGLQETSPNCRSALEPLFGSSPYKMIGKHNTVMYSKYDNINFSSIIYNSDTVKSIGNCTNITIPDTGAPIYNEGFQSWNFLVINMIAWLKTGKHMLVF